MAWHNPHAPPHPADLSSRNPPQAGLPHAQRAARWRHCRHRAKPAAGFFDWLKASLLSAALSPSPGEGVGGRGRKVPSVNTKGSSPTIFREHKPPRGPTEAWLRLSWFQALRAKARVNAAGLYTPALPRAQSGPPQRIALPHPVIMRWSRFRNAVVLLLCWFAPLLSLLLGAGMKYCLCPAGYVW